MEPTNDNNRSGDDAKRFDLNDPDDPLECMLFLCMERDRKRSRRVRVTTDPGETEREML